MGLIKLLQKNEINRSRIKEIHLKYENYDFKKLKKIKDSKGLGWEDLVFLAIINLK